MRVLRGVFAALCVSIALLASRSEAELAKKDEDGVFILGHDTFDETASSSQVVVVYFYTNWCATCNDFYNKNFTAVMRETASLENVAFAKINCQDAQSLAEKYQIASYPAMVIFRDGTYYPYDSSDKSTAAITASVKNFASSSWTKPDMYTDHLTESTFESTVKGGDGMLVKYYVRWCGHCRAMGGEWDKAARVVEKLQPPIRMYQVDCEADKQLCTDHKVDGYPALRFFRNGKLIETYSGERKRDDFVSYLKRKTGAGSKALTATKERLNEHIQALHKRGQPAIVGFFTSEDTDSHDVFEMVADEMRDHLEIVHVVSDTLGKSFGVDEPNGIHISQPAHLRSPHEKNVHVKYNFADDKEDLKNWIVASSRPLVGHLQKHNTGHDSIYHNIAVATFYYTVDFGPSMLKATQFWRRRILRIAKDYVGHPNLTFAVQDDEVASGFLNSIGLGEQAFDVAFSITSAEGKFIYPLAEDWDEDAIREHIDAFLAGTLEPWMKSETVPARNPGPVKICVAKSFKKLYGDLSQDVMIQFYAPWCPYCREFEPKYLKLARQVRKTNKNMVFLKYNIMDNQLPAEFEGLVTGYPTTYMRRAGDSEKYRYEGLNEIEPYAEFIQKTLEKPRGLAGEEEEPAAEAEDQAEPEAAESDSSHSHASDEL